MINLWTIGDGDDAVDVLEVDTTSFRKKYKALQTLVDKEKMAAIVRELTPHLGEPEWVPHTLRGVFKAFWR